MNGRRRAAGTRAAAASELAHSNRRPDGRVCQRARKRVPLFIKPARQTLLRAVVLLASWAIGLVVAARVVPGVSLSARGFIVAVAVFAVTQAILSLSILKLPHRYVPLLLGGTGLALTIVALTLGCVLTHGLTIDGLGMVQVVVSRDDEEQARALLATAEQGTFRLKDDAEVQE